MTTTPAVTPYDHAPDRKTNMRSVERAFDVIGVLERSDVPLRLSEISLATGLAPATTLRILGVLQGRGYVIANRRGYGLGPAPLAASYRYLATNEIPRACHLVLRQLSDTTGITASAHIRLGLDRILIARVEGRQPLRYTLEVGRRLSLLSGTGKLLAAYMPPDELDALLSSKQTTASPVSSDPAEFRRLLSVIKEQDYCLSPSERMAGALAISVPIRTGEGTVVASMSLGAPAELFDEAKLMQFLPELRRAAAQVHVTE